MFCSYDHFMQKDTPIPDTAAKGVDMPHTNRPYKSSYRYRRYCHFPRISFSFSLCAYMIAFSRCRFGKETSAAQYPPVRNLEALPLMRYNNCWQLFIPLDLSRFSPGLRPKPKSMAYDAAINFRRSMMKNRQRQKDTLFSILIFCSAFAVNLLIQKLFTTQTLVPMIFVFGVFLISLKTHGYCYGITSAIVSVFAVNFAFTYPYYAFDFFVEESILSAVIMLIVAVSTSTLNIRIRDQEKLRSENEKERMRGNLLRAISHDLRTPLTSIYGSSSTLISKYDALPKEQQLKLLGEIQEDSEWLIRMVENLLSVTRIDGAKVEVVKTPTVLDELIDSVLMKFSKKHPNQKVITQIPEEFVDIPMDSLLIEQVLLNLLENAVFHAKGMTELTLSVSLVGDKAVFEVADNGCGLPDDALQKIFTGSYEKSAAPVDGTRSNMGIGLSVCAAIVKAHGSEITAENRKGGGAVFRFALERGGEDDGQ